MSGNELELTRFLIKHRGEIEFPHIGVVREIGAPTRSEGAWVVIESEDDIWKVQDNDASKKADIYINGFGVSVKQSGGSFSFNRLQRANIPDVFRDIGFSDIEGKLENLDNVVDSFHNGLINGRNRPWSDFFDPDDFYTLLRHLMMDCSPNLGPSPHPADLVLEGPANGISESNIEVYSFDEYFRKYSNKIKIAIRRQWIGQSSKSEHGRATSLARKPGNANWIYDTISGSPSGWREDVPIYDRRTVYFLMLEKVV